MVQAYVLCMALPFSPYVVKRIVENGDFARMLNVEMGILRRRIGWNCGTNVWAIALEHYSQRSYYMLKPPNSTLVAVFYGVCI